MTEPLWRRAARQGLTLAGAYALVVVVAALLQTKLLYPGAGRDDGPPPDGATLEAYRAADGVTAHALRLDAPGATRTVVLFHGNGEVVGDDVALARVLVGAGLSVVLVEYRGYGHSRAGARATPGEAGMYADAEAALDALAARGVGPGRVVLWGTSLGTGVASEMASRHRGSALVLVSPYTSLVEVAASHAPWLPVRLILRDRFDTLAKAAGLTLPTLVVHGTADRVVPYAMGERVAHAIPGARLLTTDGGHANELFLGEGGRTLAEVIAFARSAASGW